MRVTDDDLKSLLPGTGAGREACPPAETLATAAAGELPEPEREAVLEHLGRCRECAEEVQALGPLAPWAAAAAGQLDEARGPARARGLWTRWPAWAAAAVVVLGLPLLIGRLQDPGPVPLRTQPGPAVRSLVPESLPLSRERCVLRWSDAGEGARYSVSVLGKDLRPLARADGLERPEYVVARDALDTVPAGGEIVWSVEARWPGGRRLVSPTFVNRLD
jgi:hypothetical protein